MGINLRDRPFYHSETNQVALAEAETESSFHLEGAVTMFILTKMIVFGFVDGLSRRMVDILDLKHIVSLAVVDETNSVMAEMMHITAQETVLLKQCEGFLSVAAAMCSGSDNYLIRFLKETPSRAPLNQLTMEDPGGLRELEIRAIYDGNRRR
ncbi:hypothetical protein DY000_02041673 [Brassica cretica]|uniref:BTB domain-containing protein n=1 Tax=Brassica cretica TaxID=69181 RepID=A0ABQ7BIA0_BRACR|nr:hypothetical protein DY000_02041673 [Brassica cretica]